MNGIFETLRAMQSWAATLPPQFAFLLALPFGVAAAGFAADKFPALAHHRSGHSSARR